MQLPYFLTAAIALVILLGIGRIVLAWLPPGTPGGHDLRTLPATLSTSFLLAMALLVAVGEFFNSDWPTLLILGTAVLLLALFRVALSPAAMVPRHEPPLAAYAWIARGGTILACILIAYPRPEHSWNGEPMCVCVVVLLLVAHALEVARVPSWARAASALLFALVVHLTHLAEEATPAFGALFFCAGAAFTVPWLRRADRRALMLAACFYSAAALWTTSDWALSVAGLAWLVIGTARPVRGRVLALALACVAVVVLIEFLRHPYDVDDLHAYPRVEIATPVLALGAALLALVGYAVWHDARHARDGTWNPSGARVGQEESILLRTLVTALLLSFATGRIAPTVPVRDAVLPALLVLTLIAGLALKRCARASVVQAPA